MVLCGAQLYPTLGLIITWTIGKVQAKGGATKGKAAGGATVVNDGQAYTDEEMQVALIIVGIIICIFISVCSCQCWQKVVWEFSPKHANENEDARPMPCAPYLRDQASMV